MNMVPPTEHDSPETTLAESARASAADAAELSDGMGGSDPARSARVADRLSEEYGEIAQMLRSLPSRPADGVSGHDWQLLAALRTAHAAGEDIGETVARALARLAWELGNAFAVLENRSGSWEASIVAELLGGTVGDGENLGQYRTTQ